MSKSQDAKKETKKKPLLSAKDKDQETREEKIVTVDASAQGPYLPSLGLVAIASLLSPAPLAASITWTTFP